MKNILGFLFVSVALFSCDDESTNNASAEADEKKSKADIEQIFVTYEKALKTSDAQLASSLYATDGVFMPSAAPTSTGTVNIKAAYEYVFSLIQPDVKFTIDSFTIFVENDLAYATSTSTGTSLLKATGEQVPEINREIFVFKRESGTWKVSKYMFNKASQ
jgi:uncharacterized protein (TIGR02246 family)